MSETKTVTKEPPESQIVTLRLGYDTAFKVFLFKREQLSGSAFKKEVGFEERQSKLRCVRE